ncbi:hypothetical protein HMPREF0290_2877 [Corynebacterium efficiens YS-314]|nr:hypothetical protein HMPREF0290_2877 [Corynebacterium efficiens YS-314]
MTASPDRGAGPEPARKTNLDEGTQSDCGQSIGGSFRVVPVPHSHYQRPREWCICPFDKTSSVTTSRTITS